MLDLDGLRADAQAAHTFSRAARRRLHIAQASLAARARRWEATRERRQGIAAVGAPTDTAAPARPTRARRHTRDLSEG
jgi:hypothetical protein